MRRGALGAGLALVVVVVAMGCGGHSPTPGPADVESRSTSQTKVAGADTWLSSAAPTANYGTANVLRCGHSTAGGKQRVLLSFNLSGVPSSATITRATLKLYAQQVTGPDTYRVHRVTAGWTEGGATWKKSAASFAASAAASATVAAAQGGKTVQFDLTDLVRWWVKNPGRNYGCLLCGAEAGAPAGVVLCSAEVADSAKRPRLVVTHNVVKQIACVSNRAGRFDELIYTMDWNGDNVKALTGPATGDDNPTWSPDGRRIAFLSGRGGEADIYVMDADGSHVARITHGQVLYWSTGECLAWSPDSKRVAFEGNTGKDDEIYVANADGSGVRRLTNHPGYDWEPSWSPSEKQLVFARCDNDHFDLWITNADGTGQTNLTNTPTSDEGDPHWSPDGSKILFNTDRGGNNEIYVIDADGSKPVNLTHSSAWDAAYSWSPDGRLIAFISDRGGKAEIWVMNADGGGPRRVGVGDYCGYVTWAPDSQRLAYSCGPQDKNYDIWVVLANGTNATNVTHSNPAFDSRPSWQP